MTLDTLADLRAAVKAKGFNDLTDDEVDQLVNDACVELDSLYLWPYREKSVTGSPAPLEIDDLGEVGFVIDLDNGNVPLDRTSWDELSQFGDLGRVGSPLYWYKAAPAGVVQIGTFPTSGHSIGVQYWRTTPVLSADIDEPLCPLAWRSLIVDIAAGSAYSDGELPAGLSARIERRLNAMVNALMGDYGMSEVGMDGVDS